MSRKHGLGKTVSTLEASTMEMVHIRSVKDYMREIIEQLGGPGAKLRDENLKNTKNWVLKAFQQELYGQIVFKYGPETAEMKPDDLADMAGIGTILQQTFRKWRRLCILCTEHGLGNWLSLEDLQDALADGPQEVVLPNPEEEDVTDKLDEILPPGEKPVYLDDGVKTEDAPEEVPDEQSAAEEPG